MSKVRTAPSESVTKRLLDVIVSAVLLILLSPLTLTAALVVLSTMGRPVLFTQNRPGLGGKPFSVVKFRTMHKGLMKDGRELSDAERLTSVGVFLRRFSIDEIPQLWSVLKGDMSLVGPRPLLIEYLDLYSDQQARRHEAKPGLTGLAQVSGRNQLSWDEKFELDVWYVDNWSVWLDIKIIVLSAVKVIRAEGISAGGSATMPLFRGSDPTDR